MKPITESFKTIILKQRALGYHMPKILNPPATEQEIAKVEEMLDLKFNDELKELYAQANGIHNDYETASGLTGLIPIHNFLSLSDAIDYYRSAIDTPEYFTNYDNNFTPGLKLFPILDDGAGNCYWVDLNQHTANHDKIFWTNTFGQDPDYLYESLTNLFGTIAEGYEKGLFLVDEEGYLTVDYNMFDEISAKNNSRLDYWNK